MSETSRYRVTLCRSIFTDVEIDAVSASAAEIAARTAVSRLKFDTRPAPFRVEKLVPLIGRPGESEWVEEEIK